MFKIDHHKLIFIINDQEVGHIEFSQKSGIMSILHTIIKSEYEGLGYASQLTSEIFRYAQENHFKIIPLCSYTQSWLKRHPEWQELIYE
ncbi:MAG: N-acetyltransferase [Acholeplasmatales bacterium]|jgi:predicted GNAT family acetyltransferase|nr:N-acetyltransferase [Acholeplasmatales bacterium]